MDQVLGFLVIRLFHLACWLISIQQIFFLKGYLVNCLEVYATCNMNMCAICQLEKGEGQAGTMHSLMTVSQ
jgi:hypothetical protein